MLFSNFDTSTKQIFIGNLLFIICCAFYLAWWLLAFKPAGAIKGLKTAWLLIPAFIAGLLAVILILQGISAITMKAPLLPPRVILLGGVILYLFLLAVTILLLKRPVTTELILIIGWAMLALSEINALYGGGWFSHAATLVFTILILAAALISLFCYILYYNLSGWAGYLDGTAPLLLAALIMAAISICMAKSHAHF